MKEIITYIIKAKTDFDDLYIYNKPSGSNPKVIYTNEKLDAREFNGMEEASINMDYHIVIEKIVTETIEYQEVDNEF